MIRDNKMIVRAAFDALTTGDHAAIEVQLAPDCVLHQCGFLEPIRGADAIKHRRPGRFLAEPEFRLERIVGEGELVAIHWRTSGIHIDRMGPDGNGQPISFMSMSFMWVEQGKIREIWNMQDMSTVDAQLQASE